MFAKLKGILDSTDTDTIIIDVGGVGYLASASRKTIDQLPAIGRPVSVIIDTHVREDKIQLFAFLSEQERDMFRLLQTLQGIGGKAALSILSALTPQQLIAAIASGDKAAVGEADGIGPKLALRVVTELKDKVGKMALSFVPGKTDGQSGNAATNNNSLPLIHAEDAISALVNLGYTRMDAFRAVANLAKTLDADTPVQKIIPAALKELAA